MKDLIINYNWRNRVSTSEVADCLGKSGRLNGDTPIKRGHFRADRVISFFAFYQSKWDVCGQIAATQERCRSHRAFGLRRLCWCGQLGKKLPKKTPALFAGEYEDLIN